MGRIISTESLDIEEQKSEYNLRPQYLSEYIGQKKVKDNLHIFIEAAKKRNEPLDHLLLYGPPGLGKTTLSTIVANEMGVNIKITSGPAIEKPGELAAILNNLSDNDILFIDEIHRLSTQVEEVLYPAMEDYAIDVVIGKGAGARSIRLDLPRFTLIGATTRVGMLSAPLRDRFGMVDKLEFYTHDDLREIVMRSAEVLGVDIDEEGALEIARRSRGTPRLANRLLKRCRDYAEVCHDGHIDHDVAKAALDKLQVDSMGLDVNDRNILMTMIEKFAGGPVPHQCQDQVRRRNGTERAGTCHRGRSSRGTVPETGQAAGRGHHCAGWQHSQYDAVGHLRKDSGTSERKTNSNCSRCHQRPPEKRAAIPAVSHQAQPLRTGRTVRSHAAQSQ